MNGQNGVDIRPSPGLYNHLVPRHSVSENLKFRRHCLELSSGNVDVQQDFICMCRRDILFWVNVFCWTYDPRGPGKIIPFVCYPFQEDALSRFSGALGKTDILVEKSRDQGATYMCLYAIQHAFQFIEYSSFLVVSRVENLVDKAEDPDSMFWKIDKNLEYHPAWLRPRMNRLKLHFHNEDNGSTIDGASTTGNVGRGGRRTAVVLDEFAAFDREEGYKALAATQNVTKCRIFNSTPQGVGNAHYDMAQRIRSVNKIRMHWSQHPIQNKGLYTSERGTLKIMDEAFWRNATVKDVEELAPAVEMREVHDPVRGSSVYPFKLDGRLRSPYYDNECERCGGVESIIAQELDIDYVGSGKPVFNSSELEVIRARDIVPPQKRGMLRFSGPSFDNGRFEVQEGGALALWLYLDAAGLPPRDRNYAIGGDISVGTGASNSVLAVGDRKTGHNVAELVCHDLGEYEFAEYAVALARFFHNAYLIWEANGPGRSFGKRVLQLGYDNIHFRTQEEKMSRDQSQFPGWFTTRDNKLVLLKDFMAAMKSSKYVCRSAECLDECREYQYMQGGGVAHVKSKSSIDPSGANENHGDRVIAHSLLWRGMQDVREDKPEYEVELPLGSFGLRRRQWEEAQKDETWW